MAKNVKHIRKGILPTAILPIKILFGIAFATLYPKFTWACCGSEGTLYTALLGYSIFITILGITTSFFFLVYKFFSILPDEKRKFALYFYFAAFQVIVGCLLPPLLITKVLPENITFILLADILFFPFYLSWVTGVLDKITKNRFHKALKVWARIPVYSFLFLILASIVSILISN
jgi:hypothetical protein